MCESKYKDLERWIASEAVYSRDASIKKYELLRKNLLQAAMEILTPEDQKRLLEGGQV